MTSNPFWKNRFLQGLIFWLIVLWIVTAINPLYPRDWLLENLLVFIYSMVLIVTYKGFQFSNISYAMLSIFLSFHLVGAHYTYSETPFGFWLQDWFLLERNHYDRIVHFSFGLLVAYPFREVLIRLSGINLSWSYFMPIVTVLAFSAFYELLEGIVAVIVSPELGMAYLGTQGDIWDAQKDSFLAFMGSIAAMLINWLYVKSSCNTGD